MRKIPSPSNETATAKCGTVSSFDLNRDVASQLVTDPRTYRVSDTFSLLLPDISFPIPAIGRRPLCFPTALHRKPDKAYFWSRDGPAA